MNVAKYTNIIIVLSSTVYYNSSHFKKSNFSSLSGEIYIYIYFSSFSTQSGHPVIGTLKYSLDPQIFHFVMWVQVIWLR